MMRSLYSGVSGLKNHQVRMDVIGNKHLQCKHTWI
jgi:flagellar hook protein FlgE